MASDFTIIWTSEALENLGEIIEYLEIRWRDKEVAHFKKKLSSQLLIIQKFHTLFPKSDQAHQLHKAVLSKQTSIIYQISDSVIYIVYLFDNRQDPSKIH